MSCLPPSFCITMPQRLERAKAQFQQQGLDVKMYPAFNANAMKFPRCGEPYLDDWGADHWAPPYGHGTEPAFYCGPGIHALATSWYALVKFGLAMNYDHILVFEDDATLCDNFLERYTQVRSELPADFDMMHWGWGCLNDGTKKMQSTNTATAEVLCTQAVELSRRAMLMIEEKAESRTPIDIFFFRQIVPYVKSFIAYPMLVEQESIKGALPTLLS